MEFLPLHSPTFPTRGFFLKLVGVSKEEGGKFIDPRKHSISFDEHFQFLSIDFFFLVNLGSPQEVRVDMYVANIWAMEEVKMVTII